MTYTIATWFEDRAEEGRLSEYLHKHNYAHVSCQNKEEFDKLLGNPLTVPAVIIIDLNIREADAILTCNEIKSHPSANTPFVIIAGDKAEEYTHVTALDLGADDYVVKPIKPQLMLKRVEALMWRKKINGNHPETQKEGFHIDSERHLVIIDGNTFELPKKEFELLNLFYSVPNKIFSRQEIAVLLWKEESIARQRTIDVHIRNIRKTLGQNLIKTVKGLGYGLNKA